MPLAVHPGSISGYRLSIASREFQRAPQPLHSAALLSSNLQGVLGGFVIESDRTLFEGQRPGRGTPMSVATLPKSDEANDILTAQADERLAHAYDQIARADEQLARLTAQLSRMEQDTPRQSSTVPPAAVLRQRPPRGTPLLRGFVGLLAATCIIGAGLISWSEDYGEAVKPIIARWVMPYSASWLQPARAELPAQPGRSGVRLASAEPAPAQATQAAAPTATLTSPELMQLLQTMARDLATLQQGIEQLKASEAQLASDNAKAVEQFRESQVQLARLIAKAEKTVEPDPRARTATPPPRPVAEPARRPVPAQASSQARAQPIQLQPAPR